MSPRQYRLTHVVRQRLMAGQSCRLYVRIIYGNVCRLKVIAAALGRCLSVCLSVWPSVVFVYCIRTTKDIVKFFSLFGSPIILFFSKRQYPVARFSGALSTQWSEKFPIFAWNRCLCCRGETVRDSPWLYGTLLESHRWPIDRYRFRWPWVTLKGGTRMVNFSGGSIITLVPI